MTEIGALYLIPTPISNEAPESIQVQKTSELVKSIKYYLVENLRTARRFLSSLHAGLVIDELQFFLLDKNTTQAELSNFWKEIPLHEKIGVLSEAGCPGIADPGAMAVKKAHQSGRKVIPVVGPSSIFLALMASGFSGQSFTFHGYLPIEKDSRKKMLKELEKTAVRTGQTQIFMETPYRNQTLLKDILETLEPETLLCLAANITAPGEFILTQKIADWKSTAFPSEKVPAVFLIGN